MAFSWRCGCSGRRTVNCAVEAIVLKPEWDLEAAATTLPSEQRVARLQGCGQKHERPHPSSETKPERKVCLRLVPRRPVWPAEIDSMMRTGDRKVNTIGADRSPVCG